MKNGSLKLLQITSNPSAQGFQFFPTLKWALERQFSMGKMAHALESDRCVFDS